MAGMVAPRPQSEGCEFDPRGGLLTIFGFLPHCKPTLQQFFLRAASRKDTNLLTNMTTTVCGTETLKAER